MCANKWIAVVLMGVAGAAGAQTIDEISNLNRLKVVKELRDKAIGPDKSGVPGMPAISAPGAVPGMPVPGAVSPAPIAPARTTPMLMGIYGVGTALVAELEEDGYTTQYRKGDVTAGGWTVRRIDGSRVSLSKGSGKKPKTISLTFGSKVELPKEAVMPAAPGGMMPPPMPMPVPPPGGVMAASFPPR